MEAELPGVALVLVIDILFVSAATAGSAAKFDQRGIIVASRSSATKLIPDSGHVWRLLFRWFISGFLRFRNQRISAKAGENHEFLFLALGFDENTIGSYA